MRTLKHIALFMNHDRKHLQRKWHTLPLLLLFPILMIASILLLIITYFSSSEEQPIRVGLVDLDQSEETQLVVELIEDSSQLGSFIQLDAMTEKEANAAIDANQMAAYITFPDHFTDNLYEGSSITLPLVGNSKQPTESRIINELMESITRHIRYSQANILTINSYMKQLPIEKKQRNDILFEQFKQFFFYVLAKDKTINEKEIDNQATSQTNNYYAVSLWFIILTIWLFVIYQFLIQEQTLRMTQRMKLYGVTELQQHIARIAMTLIVSVIFSFLLFIGLQRLLNWELYIEDYRRIFLVCMLYSNLFLLLLSCLHTLFSDRKISLLIQSIFTVGLLLLSGAIVPVIYFPLPLQSIITYFFTNNAFHWLIEIIINGRFYADYIPLLAMNFAGIFLLLGLSFQKERMRV